MTVRQLAKEALMRAIVGIAIRRGVREVLRIGRFIRGVIGTAACHREAIDLLNQWVKWAPVAKDSEVPGPLFVATLTMIRDHRSGSGDFEVSGAMFTPTPDQNGQAGVTTEPPATGQTVPEEGSAKSGG